MAINTSISKKTLFIIGGAFVLFLMIILAINLPSKVPPKEEKPAGAKISTPQITQAAEGQLPEGFPASVPLNGKKKIIQAQTAIIPADSVIPERSILTVLFDSSKTPKQNYDFYTKWAKDNGWEIISQSEEEALSSLYLRKGTEDINIAITDTSISLSYIK